MEVLKELPTDRRIGVGVVNPKPDQIETVEELVARDQRAIELFGKDRVLFTPDCGFTTFADNPVASARVAESTLRALAAASALLRA